MRHRPAKRLTSLPGPVESDEAPDPAALPEGRVHPVRLLEAVEIDIAQSGHHLAGIEKSAMSTNCPAIRRYSAVRRTRLRSRKRQDG
jgi:hypothetical protein